MSNRKKRLIVFAFTLFFAGLIVTGVALFWPSQQGCVGADCGAGSQYCASGCCLGTTVVDIVNGCEIRSWGCASQWSLSNTFTCGGGCDGNYDQKGCSPNWISVPVYIPSTCSRQDCSTVCGWEASQSCSYQWVRHCTYYGYCWWEQEQVCNTYYSWECHEECTTVYYACQIFWGYEQQVSSCSLVSNPAWTNCCGSGPPPTPTNAPPPPPPATATAVPTPVPTRTVVPTPLPLVANLTPRYGSLVLMAPKLGLPAQTLNGVISGGTAPYAVTLYVQAPDNSTTSYSLSPGVNFSFGPGEAGDPYFGVTQEGTWRAWFTVTDNGGHSATSNTATWRVVFYPVHGAP